MLGNAVKKELSVVSSTEKIKDNQNLRRLRQSKARIANAAAKSIASKVCRCLHCVLLFSSLVLKYDISQIYQLLALHCKY